MNERKRCGELCAMLCACALWVSPLIAAGQDPPPPIPAPDPAPSPQGLFFTVSGVVVNATTGAPLPRALVTIINIDGLGALSDGDGRFEIPGVPAGLQPMEVIKPGFQSPRVPDEEDSHEAHTVRVAAGMPEITFSLAPKNAIEGHITLSSGLPSEGIGIRLLGKTVNNGRAVWKVVESHQCTPDGAFRFSGLSDGTYLLATDPEFDSLPDVEEACTPGGARELSGFAAVCANGARDIDAAPRIVVAGGQTAEVNLALQATKFHRVEIAVARAPVRESWTFTHRLFDQAGWLSPYPVHEEKDHSLCTYLPDGSYAIRVEAWKRAPIDRAGRPTSFDDRAGKLDFTVEGSPPNKLRVAMAPALSTQVHVRYEPGPLPPVPAEPNDDHEEHPAPDDGPDPLALSGSRVNSFSEDPVERITATRINDNTYELDPATPGAWWIRAGSNESGVCVASVTAAGQDLTAVPWIAGPSGAGTPIDVVMRTDCARLTVQMPPDLGAVSVGEDVYAYVFAIPAFPAADGVWEGHVDQFGERTADLDDMVPGTYRVFAFRTLRPIDLHNPAAIESLGEGQTITLEPGSRRTLVQEKIAP